MRCMAATLPGANTCGIASQIAQPCDGWLAQRNDSMLICVNAASMTQFAYTRPSQMGT